MIEVLMPITENKLRTLMFIYENENAYLLSIAKSLKIHPFSLKRTIDNLIKKKILETKKIGRTVVLSLNKNFADYNGLLYEIEKYKLKTNNKILQQLFKNIQIFFSDKETVLSCILFGSFARGADNEKSDIDLFFLVKDKAIKQEILKKCSEFSIILNTEVSPVIMDEKEFLSTLGEKEPTILSLLQQSQRIIIIGIENFLKISKQK